MDFACKISFSIQWIRQALSTNSSRHQTNPPLIIPHNLNYRPRQASVNKNLQRRLSRELCDAYCVEQCTINSTVAQCDSMVSETVQIIEWYRPHQISPQVKWTAGSGIWSFTVENCSNLEVKIARQTSSFQSASTLDWQNNQPCSSRTFPESDLMRCITID